MSLSVARVTWNKKMDIPEKEGAVGTSKGGGFLGAYEAGATGLFMNVSLKKILRKEGKGVYI